MKSLAETEKRGNRRPVAGGESARPRRLPFAAGLAAVGLAGFAVRASHVLSVLASPAGETLVQDAAFYHREALRIVGAIAAPGPGGPSFMNVGLPYALAAVYSIAGPSVRAALLVQAVLGSLTAVLLALAVERMIGSRRVALAAGLLWAIYAQSVFYDGLLLTPSLTNDCLAVALLLVALLRRGGTPLLAAAAGLAVGLASALRANLLLLVPVVALLLLFVPAVAPRAGDRRARRLAALLFVAGAAVVPLPIVLINGATHGEWVPVSANGGMNFWVGNNQEAQGIYYTAPFLPGVNPDGEMRSYLDEARRRTGNPSLTLAGSSSFWLREGLRDVGAHFARWLRIEGRKFVLFWNAFEVNTNVGFAFVRGVSPVLASLPIGFGALAIFGVAGIALLFLTRRHDAAWLSAALVLVPLATVLLFFVSGEYRHPASLGLAIGAAVAVDAIWTFAEGRLAGRRAGGARPRQRGPASRAGWALAAGAAIVPMAAWDFPQLRLGCHPRYDYENYAREMVAPRPDGSLPGRDAFERAERLLDLAPDSDSDLVLLQARLDLHSLGARILGDHGEARRAVDAAGALASHDLAAGQGEYADAFLARVLRDIPGKLDDLARLDVVRGDPALGRELSLLGAGRWSEIEEMVRRSDVGGALLFAREALKRTPFDPDLQAEMGRLLLLSGRESEGLAWLERSCSGWVETPRCAEYAANYLASRGRSAEAREAALEARRRREAHGGKRDR